eukprot:2166366-Pleurochrysis_carterae.AAC.2
MASQDVRPSAEEAASFRFGGTRARPRKGIEATFITGQTYLKPPGSCLSKWPQLSIGIEVECCEGCSIYILDVASQVQISDCRNCRIVIGLCTGSVFLLNCVDCTVSVAAAQLRLRDVQANGRAARNSQTRHSAIFRSQLAHVFSPHIAVACSRPLLILPTPDHLSYAPSHPSVPGVLRHQATFQQLLAHTQQTIEVCIVPARIPDAHAARVALAAEFNVGTRHRAWRRAALLTLWALPGLCAVRHLLPSVHRINMKNRPEDHEGSGRFFESRAWHTL